MLHLLRDCKIGHVMTESTANSSALNTAVVHAQREYNRSRKQQTLLLVCIYYILWVVQTDRERNETPLRAGYAKYIFPK